MKSIKFAVPLVALMVAVIMAFSNVTPATQGYAKETIDASGTLRSVVNITGSQSCTVTPNSNPKCLVNVPFPGPGDVQAYDKFQNGVAIDILYRTPN